MPGLAASASLAPARRSSLTETPAGPLRTRILPLPPSCSISHLAAVSPHLLESVLILAVTWSVSTRLSKLMTAMPLAQAASMTRAGAVDEPAMSRIASTSASIIDWICWIWVLASPWASVITSSSTSPSFLSSSTIEVIVPSVCFIQVGTE